MILAVWMLNFKPAFSLSSFTLIKRLFCSSLLSAIEVVSLFLPAILTPTCESFSAAFHMMYSAYNLDNQVDDIQHWHTTFPILNQSIVLCPVLTVASWPAYKFLRRKVRWSDIHISLRIFHSLLYSHKDFSIVNEAEVNTFLELPCFLHNPMNVGNLISVPLTLQNTACTCRISQFMCWWSLAWRILSITLLTREVSAIVWYFEHSLARIIVSQIHFT